MTLTDGPIWTWISNLCSRQGQEYRESVWCTANWVKMQLTKVYHQCRGTEKGGWCLTSSFTCRKWELSNSFQHSYSLLPNLLSSEQKRVISTSNKSNKKQPEYINDSKSLNCNGPYTKSISYKKNPNIEKDKPVFTTIINHLWPCCGIWKRDHFTLSDSIYRVTTNSANLPPFRDEKHVIRPQKFDEP